MPAIIERRLNRVIRRVVALADIPTTALVVDVRIDPSQQFMLYGVTFGMELLLQADRGVILFQPCQAFLNIDASTITGAVVPDLNAALDSPFYDSITEGNETLKSLDFANPIIINGDRSITFVLFPPFSSAAFGGTPTFILEVRGEVTQISNDDKPRFGKWVIR